MSQCLAALLLYIVDHRRSYMCRFVCNARLWRNYVRRILCLPSRVAHSLVWIFLDCHGIVALLVISGKQPSSELLHTLRFICVVCWPPKRQRSISTTSSPQHGSTSCLPRNFLARVTISTNVDDTASSHRARVSHNIHNRLESLDCV